MHNKLLPEVTEAIKHLDKINKGKIGDIHYIKVPKDMFSPFRDCIVKLEKLASGWHISPTGNEHFNESL